MCYVPYPYPRRGVCPGCGRCRDCGQPPVPSPAPWPTLPPVYPYTPGPIWVSPNTDPTYPYVTNTC